jgi:UDP-N-acetylglucosamine diphosphorylase / glucose-1-phosphate thymidylyltransferase / UDP-N-acetylgalactosamine diphosphorylase / glucosamine-1-phosphate N-acetyltransferase / galactosamine-1-phosphate N-acetyltransferase
VVLARGLGSRMRRVGEQHVALTGAQEAAAATGAKAMMPIADATGRERPFLDWILSGLADAGVATVVLVVAPDHAALLHYYESAPPQRVHLEFVVQEHPLGTANAVLAVEPVVPPRFLVMNGDNLYPTAAIQALRSGDGASCIAFDGGTLVRDGNIPLERLRAFARLDVASDGQLRGITEKPDDAELRTLDWPVSMNLWAFDATIFAACRSVPRSRRGEFELPEAVDLGVRSGTLRVLAHAMAEPVWDLSGRADVETLGAQLHTIPVEP